MVSIKALIVSIALGYGVDPQIALSVAFVESGFRHDAVSHTNDYGVFQLNHRYFKNAPELTVEENINKGIKHLKFTKKHCKIDTKRLFYIWPYSGAALSDLWVVCYNRGVNGLKGVKKPWELDYYRKIQDELNGLKNISAEETKKQKST